MHFCSIPSSLAQHRLPVAIVAAVLLISQIQTVALADPLSSIRDTSQKPPLRVSISKETTRITAPLREDGYPDYVRYLNEKLREGVTPQNNAIVPLARTMGLLDVEDHIRTEYFKLLGIEPPPKDGKYFETWWSYTARTPEAEQPRVPPGDNRLQKDYFSQLVEVAASRPWTAREFPHVAKWLRENDEHLDAIVAASKLPRAYSPWVIGGDEQFKHRMLIAATLMEVDHVQDATQALCCRAMLRAAEGNARAGKQDLLAAQRWAVLLASSPHLVHFIRAKGIECDARSAGIQLCAHTSLTRADLADFRNGWTTFPTVAALASAIDISERLQFLDAGCFIAREGWHVLLDLLALITDLSGDGESKPRKKPNLALAINSAIFTWLVRWDEPLTLGNQWYDRLVKIVRIENRNEQVEALEHFDRDLERLRLDARKLPTALGFFFYPRAIPTRFTSKTLVGVMLPPVFAPISVARHLESYRSMFDVSMALLEYRAEHKAYPRHLRQLLPNYLRRLPRDDYGHELVYRPSDSGFILYSLGPNGRDDGGRDWNEDEDADDIIVRVPPTSATAIKQ